MICCGSKVIEYDNVDFEGSRGYGLFCESCGNKSAGRTKEDAEKAFTPKKEPKPEPKKPTNVQEKKPMNNHPPRNNHSQTTALAKTDKIYGFFHDNRDNMELMVSPVMDGNLKAMKRLWENNTERYPMSLKGPAWARIFDSEEGVESIRHEIEESLMIPCELGVTGDLVPYGTVCKLIPSVEALEFALTSGKNSPFEWIKIECVYVGDVIKSGRKDGNFYLDFQSFGDERTEVKSVYVYGLHKKSGKVIGEAYDAKRLLQKAAEHSGPYENYLKIYRAYEYAKTEGKVSIDANGRESFIYYTIKDTENDKYFQKSVDNFYAMESAGKLKKDSKGEYAVEVIPKSGGGTWEKKTYRYEIEGGKEEKRIYIDELKNPYAGPDQPEMLRKAAGKSFLNVYKKTRNTGAAMQEIKSHKQAMKAAMDLADEQFDDDVIDGEVE